MDARENSGSEEMDVWMDAIVKVAPAFVTSTEVEGPYLRGKINVGHPPLL